MLLLAGLALLIWVARPLRTPGWITLVAGLAALAWQTSFFGAYLPIMSKQVQDAQTCAPGRSLTLLNVNVLQDNRRYSELLELVARTEPDIFLLLETDEAWAKAVEPLGGAYPHRVGEPLSNTYGMILFSKLPMEAQVRHRLQPDIPSIAALVRLPGGDLVRFHGVHPEPPLPGDDSGERDAELVMVGRDVRRTGRAAIVMGDLNDVAWSRTSRLFRQLSAANDPRRGRGLYPTYHADYPFARWPLDHLFVTSHFRLMDMARLGDIGSDHFPMFYRLCLAEAPSKRSAPATAPAEVRRQAAEEVEEGVREKRSEGVGQ